MKTITQSTTAHAFAQSDKQRLRSLMNAITTEIVNIATASIDEDMCATTDDVLHIDYMIEFGVFSNLYEGACRLLGAAITWSDSGTEYAPCASGYYVQVESLTFTELKPMYCLDGETAHLIDMIDVRRLSHAISKDIEARFSY